MRFPTTVELNLINTYRPKGSEPYDTSEILTIPIVASNNLLHHHFGKWDIPSLESMVKYFPGVDLMFDHAHNSSERSMGFVYDSEIWIYDAPSDEDLQVSVSPDLDRAIVNRDGGYYQVILNCAIEANHPIASGVRFRRVSDVSISGFRHGDDICPLCGIPFTDSRCPHYPPIPELIDWWYDEKELEHLAPYWIRTGFNAAIELSFVVKGNCPQAKIISN